MTAAELSVLLVVTGVGGVVEVSALVWGLS